MFALASLLLAAVPLENHDRACATVTGTYAIYANHDLLRIDGSRHYIEITSNRLDSELDARGWETTVAKGRFTLCGRRVTSTRNWTIRDRVALISFHNIHFLSEPPNKARNK